MRSQKEKIVRVLVIDPKPADSRLLRTILNQRKSKQLKLEFSVSASLALEQLSNRRFDAILLSGRSDSKTQFNLLRRLTQSKKQVPVLIVGENQNESTLQKFLKSGCVYYLDQERLSFESFWLAVQNAVFNHEKEQLLFEKIEKLELAIEGSTHGLWDWILPGDWQSSFDGPAWYSERFKQLLGYRDTEFPNRWSAWIIKIHEEDKKDVIRVIKNHLKSGSACDIECRINTYKFGYRWFRIRGSSKRTLNGLPIRFSGSLIDITERKNAQFALQESEAKFRTVFENSAVGITVADEKERIVSFNSFIDRLLGYSHKDLYLRPVSSLYPKEEWKKIRSHHIRKIGMKHHLETKMVKKDGSLLDVDISITILKDMNGRKIGSIGITRDISERKKSEIEFQTMREEALNANRAKSDFLANMSHEIRTPLNAIIGFSELLQATKMDELQADYSNTIRDSAELLLELISDILDISKIEARQIELERVDFNLQELVEGLLKIVSKKAKTNSVELCYQLAHEVPIHFNGDPLRIRQILLNLLGNAVKFTEKGQVGIFVKCPKGTVEEESEKIKTLLISVKDTGIGIPQDKQALIFQPFMQADTSTTRKFGGTGLGLAIAKALVQMMGGRFWVESAVGKGSEFFFTVKLREAQSDQAPSAVAPVEDLKNKKVLIVDDYEMAQRIAEIYCKELGLDVVGKCFSVADALSWMNRNFEDGGRKPDLVLCDIRIPDADGFEFAKRIRLHKRFSDLKLIAMSLDVNPGMKQKSKEAGFDFFLPKPIIRGDLMKSIQEVFGNRLFAKSFSSQNGVNGSEFKNLKILVAEDNSINQKLMDQLLNSLGCSHDFASNGLEAIERIKERSYDLVLMDLQMPQMGGLEAAQIIRRDINKTLPIIALTAAAMKKDQEQSLESGMNDYISKPINFSKLKEKIAAWTKPVEMK